MMTKDTVSPIKSEKSFFQEPSKLDLMATTFSSSIWVFGKAMKIAFKLNKEMFGILLRGPRRGSDQMPSASHIFTNYGVWFIDLYSLIRQEMDLQT